MKILFVEDNADLREGIAEIMAAPGRSIVSCADAEDGLAHFGSDRFDVVITDVSLPGMSGTDFARLVLASRPSQRIVLCTGYEFGALAGTLGPSVQTLTKPFELESMEALLAQLELEVLSEARASG